MARPTKYPRWADNGGIIVEPTELKKDVGWLTSEKPPAQYINWDLNLVYQWIKWLDGMSGNEFGDGSDGNATLDGVAVVPWATLGGNGYTMNRDVYLQDLTLSQAANKNLFTAGYRLYVNGKLTTAVAAQHINNDGSNGLTFNAGAGGGSGTLGGGANGGAGGLGVGAPAVGANIAADGVGGAGGLGGDGDSGGGGPHSTPGAAGGTVTAITANQGRDFHHISTLFGGHVVGAGALTVLQGGAGGGGGCGSIEPNNGGGGGGGGGVAEVAIRQIVLGTDLHISCDGGDGGPTVQAGPNFAGGGGGGGGGGLRVTRGSTQLNGHTLSITANGGAGGTSFIPSTGGGSSQGAAGAAGTVNDHDLGALSALLSDVGHHEDGVVTMSAVGVGDGVDFIDIAFARPFGSTAYKFKFSAYNADGPVQVGLVMTNKTVNGFRITPPLPFNGEISWEAKE